MADTTNAAGTAKHDGVFITCAVTGSGYTAHKSDQIPVTPQQIAESSIEAAKAGAAVVHIHVRDDDGMPSRSVEKYQEVAERIRSSDTDVVLNLTAGMGGDLILGDVEHPLPPADEGTDMAGATARVEHVRAIRPEICTLDCGSMNFGEGDYVMTNTPAMLEAMAAQMKSEGMTVSTIAVGSGSHGSLMQAIAAAGGGQAALARDSKNPLKSSTHVP